MQDRHKYVECDAKLGRWDANPHRGLKLRFIVLTPLNRAALREMVVCIQVLVLPPLAAHLFSE